MPILNHFDVASVDPAVLVNREDTRKWLRARLEGYLKASDNSSGRAVALLGERGIGKSIVMRSVISELKELHMATTLFLEVDCRKLAGRREVYRQLADRAVKELGIHSNVSSELKATAQLLYTIAGFDTAERREVAEQAASHHVALGLGGARNLLAMLGINYDIKLGLSATTRASLDGKLSFSAERLQEALLAFFADLREHGFDVIVVLDNLDEVRHEAYVEDDTRRKLHGEIDGLLSLAEAPIGFVVTARTYFAASLNRQIDDVQRMEPLDDDVHRAIVHGRLAREAQDTRASFNTATRDRCIVQLLSFAKTPLALLYWFKYLAESERYELEDARCALRPWLASRYSNFSSSALDGIVAVFDEGPCVSRSRERILNACRGNQTMYKQVLRSQLVLPVDFWDPYEFTLAPELHFLLERP